MRPLIPTLESCDEKGICCCLVSQQCPTLRPQGLQHTRLPCPSPSPRVCTNSCSLSQWCHPTISSSVFPFSSCLPSFPSVRVFSDESALHIRWSKYWSFSFSISSSNEDLRLISFRKDWLDLLSVQGTLKSLLQHHSINSIQKHQLFGGQPSVWSSSHSWRWHLRKAMALTMWTFTGKAMSLLFNMLTRFVTAFLLRSKCLLSSWLQSPSAVTLEP